ncbi:MAG: hypothetical protein WC248_08820 [Candidatus Methanomethylophilaceae archaeon]|jgi:hypothetical protein
MFSNEKSDFAVPVVGSLLLAMILFIYGLNSINYEYDFLESSYSLSIVLLVLGILLTFFASAALWKAYLIEGMTFLLIGITSICIGFFGFGVDDVFILVIVIVAAVIAFMSYRAGDMITLLINILVAVAFIGTLSGIDYDYTLIFGILTLVAGIIALYASVDDWMLVQDVASEYADDLFDEDDECNSNEDIDEECDHVSCSVGHKCDDNCDCNDKKEE